MTIYKKGLAEYFMPAAEKIADIIPRIGNPNYDMQQQLKKLMATDPTVAQKLANMGPEAVEKLYGKQMRKYAEAMPQDLNTKIMNRLQSPEVMDKLFNDPVKLQGVLRKEYGIETDTDIATNTAQATIATEQAKSAPDVAAGAASRGRQEVIDNTKTNEDNARFKSLTDRLATMKVGTITEARKKGLLSADDMALIYSHPDAYRRYNSELDEEYKKVQVDFERQRMELERKRTNHSISQDSFANQIAKLELAQEYGRASRIADGSTGRIPVKVVHGLISTPGEIARQLDIKERPKDPTEAAAWDGAREIVRQQTVETGDTLAEARNQFEIRMQADFAILRSAKSEKHEKQAALGRVRSAADKWFAGKGPIPSYQYDDKNPDVSPGFWTGGKDKTFYEEDPKIGWWKSQTPEARKAELAKITDPAQKEATLEALKKAGIKL